MSARDRFKLFPRKSASNSSVVVVVQEKPKEGSSQNIAVSDKGVQVNPDILQEAWAATHHLPPGVQGEETEPSKTDVFNAYRQLIPSKGEHRESNTDTGISSSSELQLANSALALLTHVVTGTETNATASTMMDAPVDATADTTTSATVGGPTSAIVGTVTDMTTNDMVGAQASETLGELSDVLQNYEIIEDGALTFFELVSPLMSALDQVASIHPFIKAPVTAFKVIIMLEKKRRGNDQRVMSLYFEMKDMMAVLLQLRNIIDPKQVAPDGKTIEGRMKTLCATAADDIEKCANACDVYTKKWLLVKFFQSSFWELKLAKFVNLFAKRREQFEFAMTIHTTIGVEKANVKLDAVIEQSGDLSEKMVMMIKLFRDLTTSSEKKLTARVEGMGGKAAVLDDDQKMETVVEEGYVLLDEDPESQRDRGVPFNYVEIRQEIKADPEEAIEKNAESFNRKFEMQKEQIVNEITRALSQETNRIISSAKAGPGPHDRVVDQDLRKVWEDMRWRGSVKARHFVMALRDHYVEKAPGDSGSLAGPDSWALMYINIGRAHGIQEVFDGDASGVVTINGVNNFTQSKFSNWSLPHWIAYWAIGWQMTCTTYCVKIEEIFDAMIRLSYDILPENRQAISDHINGVWRRVIVFVQSIKREGGTKKLRSKFESYVTAEEERIQQSLHKFKYQIDGSDTVQVICGESRPETTLFPMFYLALKRDLEKFSLAQKHVLSIQELVDSRTTIDSIVDVAFDRIERLRGIFGQQNLEAKGQFKVFAKGLYNVGNANGSFFPEDQLRDLPDAIPCSNEIIPKPDSTPLSVLNHPTGKRLEINFAAYDPPELTLSPVEGVHPVLGVYYGFMYQRGRPTNPMIKLTFNKGEGESTFVASGSHFRESWYKHCNVTGNWSPRREDGKIQVEFKMIYSSVDWGNAELFGLFDPEENSLRGRMEMPNSKLTGEFVFKRHPDFVRFYPAPSVINARKRWEFAVTSILDRVRREAWSRQRIFKKLKDGERFMDLTLRDSHYGMDLAMDEEEELLALFPGLYEADAQFYASLIDINRRKNPTFTFITCNNCGNHPVGSRIVCMACTKPTVNLCSKSECVHSTVTFEAANKKPHLPNHAMFKVYRFIFYRDIGRIERTARDTLNYARETISKLTEEGDPMPLCLFCKTPVSLPCWCCVECTGDKFICDSCEHKQLAFGKTHTKMHTIVGVPEDVEEELSTGERLRLVEDELARMRQTLERLVGRG